MKIDPSKIKNPYQLLAVFLIVIETLLGYWMYQASFPYERIIVGILITIIFIVFLFKVVSLRRLDSSVISPPGLDTITPAKNEVESTEIESTPEEQIAGPHGRYVIDKPPNNWDIKFINIDEWGLEMFDITDPNLKKQYSGTSPFSDDILHLSSKNKISILPETGKTLVNGRKFHTALEITIRTQLSILDVERFLPPTYVEGNLEHSVLTIVSGVTQLGLALPQKITSGLISNKRQFYMYEFCQDIKNAKINGEDGKNCKIYIVILGIEGDVRDHFLVFRYGILESSDENDNDIETLSKLSDSFKPLKILNADEEKTKIKNQAEDLYQKVIQENGESMFRNELSVFFARLIDKDLENREVQNQIIEQLKMFEIFYNKINLKTNEFDDFLKLLHEANKGNFTKLSAFLKDSLKAQQK